VAASGVFKGQLKNLLAARGNGFASIERLAATAGISRFTIERLAEADAFRSLGLDRRAALWAARRLDVIGARVTRRTGPPWSSRRRSIPSRAISSGCGRSTPGSAAAPTASPRSPPSRCGACAPPIGSTQASRCCYRGASMRTTAAASRARQLQKQCGHRTRRRRVRELLLVENDVRAAAVDRRRTHAHALDGGNLMQQRDGHVVETCAAKVEV